MPSRRASPGQLGGLGGTKIARYDGYYASVLYTYFLGLPAAEVPVEDNSSRRRLDMAVRAYGRMCLLEFKVRKRLRTGSVMAQLKERGYAE